MSLQTLPSSPGLLPPLLPPEPVMRLSVEIYHDMIRHGILTDEDRVELLEGWMVEKMPKNPRHSLVTDGLRSLLEELGSSWHARSQEPVTLEDGEPEPDISIVRGKRLDYAERHPGPREVGALIEVSDSTLERDRGIKKRSYARARIPVYWIVNLVDRTIEVYTNPSGPGEKPDYAEKQEYAAAEKVPLVLDGNEHVRIKLEQLLP